MLIFLYGPDGYRLRENLNKIVESYKHKHSSGFNLFYLDLGELSGQSRLSDAFKSVSFFDEVKLLVCRNLFSSKKASELVLDLAKRYGVADAKETVLLMAEDYPEKELSSKNKELFKLANDGRNLVRSFDFLEGVKLNNWIKAEFVSRNCVIEDSAVRKLTLLAGNDSWSLINEINKIANYKEAGRVSLADIDDSVSPREDFNIFDLIDAVGAKNKPKALELLYKEIRTGRDPYYILTMLVYQFRNLLTIKDLSDRGASQAEIIKKSGLHPFVVRKVNINIDRLSAVEIKKIFNYLMDADIRVKAGTANIEDSLYRLVLG